MRKNAETIYILKKTATASSDLWLPVSGFWQQDSGI
jgi:hypothetical protein